MYEICNVHTRFFGRLFAVCIARSAAMLRSNAFCCICSMHYTYLWLWGPQSGSPPTRKTAFHIVPGLHARCSATGATTSTPFFPSSSSLSSCLAYTRRRLFLYYYYFSETAGWFVVCTQISTICHSK